MRERRLLVSSSAGGVEKRVFDVNVLAVFLASGHPGFESVSPVVEAGLRGAYVPLIMDVLPLRAFWVMTRRWGLPESECAEAITHFVRTYDVPRYPGLKPETILEGFRLAGELRHDVFDCMYLALAHQEKAKGIVTTDTDFKRLCKHTGLTYVNPVPEELLKQFKEQNK